MTLREQGFTIVELMTTVLVLSLILTLGVPSFAEIATQNRVTAQTNDFITTLNLARSEAVKRGGQVTVLRTGANWEQGWSVFFDANEDEAFNDDGDGIQCEANEDCRVLTKTDALAGGSTLRVPGGGAYANYIRFDAIGVVSGSTTGSLDLRLCPSDAQTSKARTIRLDTVGRVRLTQGATACP